MAILENVLGIKPVLPEVLAELGIPGYEVVYRIIDPSRASGFSFELVA